MLNSHNLGSVVDSRSVEKSVWYLPKFGVCPGTLCGQHIEASLPFFFFFSFNKMNNLYPSFFLNSWNPTFFCVHSQLASADGRLYVKDPCGSSRGEREVRLDAVYVL